MKQRISLCTGSGCCILQWLFLVRLFDDSSMCRRLEQHCEEFFAVHTKFVVRIRSASCYSVFKAIDF